MSRIPTLGPRGEGWVLLQAILLALAFIAGLAGLATPWWGDPIRLGTALAGIVLIAGGALLAVRGMRDLGGNLTPLPHPTADARLVEDGIYGRVRHPIYGGIMLGAAGWGLLTASLPALVMALVLVGFFGLKSRLEESWLEARFPGYATYRTRTRRFIPWPGGGRG